MPDADRTSGQGDGDIMDTLELLTKARAIQAKQGHAKGQLYDHNTGGVCVVGALIGVIRGGVGAGTMYVNPSEMEVIHRGLAALGLNTFNVCPWNNRPTTTLEDSLARFDRGIAQEAGELNPEIPFFAEPVRRELVPA